MTQYIDMKSTNLELTPSMADYLEKKLMKAIKTESDSVTNIKVNLSSETRTGTFLVDIILFLRGGKTFCNKTHSPDMYASMDIACANIERQVKKMKAKQHNKKREKNYDKKLELVEDYAIAS